MAIRYGRVREFLQQGEGAPPPEFVGRETILEDILKTSMEQAGRPKVTRIVQGAPGAGKTSLLHEMQRRWTGGNGTPRVVTLSSTDITDDTAVGVGAVLDAWTMNGKSWKRAVTDRLKRVNTISAGPGSLSVGFSDAEVPETLRKVARKHPARESSVPIIVAVDEAQRFAGDRTTPEARFLQAIHDGTTGLPLTLVLAGLSDTHDRAREMHLTRGIAVREIGGLEAREPETFMERLGQHFGLDISRQISRLHDLADICDGWPRHLHHAGVALAEAALKVDGDLDRIDWSWVMDETKGMRHIYYENQYSPEMRQARSLVSAVMRDIPSRSEGTATRPDLADVLISIARIRRTGDSPQDIPWHLPRDMDIHGFLDHLIHQGALYDDGRGSVHSPIPSFRTYLIEAGAEPKPGPDVRKNDGGDDDTSFSFRMI